VTGCSVLGSWCPGDGDRPPPPDVARIGAREGMGDNSLVVCGDTQMIPDRACRCFGFGRGTGEVHGLGRGRVELYGGLHLRHSMPGRGTRRKIQMPWVESPLPATICNGKPSMGTSCRSGKENR
jgi:hypothetical protein